MNKYLMSMIVVFASEGAQIRRVQLRLHMTVLEDQIKLNTQMDTLSAMDTTTKISELMLLMAVPTMLVTIMMDTIVCLRFVSPSLESLLFGIITAAPIIL